MKLLMAAQRADEIGICERVNEQYGFDITYTTRTLSWDSREMAQGYEAVAVNAGCIVDEKMAAYLHEQGVKYLLTRTAGSDHLDVAALAKYGIPAANVPAYSPGAIAEHTVLLLLCALRRLREQLHRIDRQDYFILGLRGREIRSLTVGVLGAGRIGETTLRILSGFGCRLLACDACEKDSVRAIAQYVDCDTLLRQSDALLLHCPMTPENRHLIDESALSVMKDGAILVNTARGGLVDTQAVLDALKSGKLSAFAMDVYEHEDLTQRHDLGGRTLAQVDPLLAELLAMENVIYTSHTAFYTDEAIAGICEVTLRNLHDFVTAGSCANALRKEATRP